MFRGVGGLIVVRGLPFGVEGVNCYILKVSTNPESVETGRAFISDQWADAYATDLECLFSQ